MQEKPRRVKCALFLESQPGGGPKASGSQLRGRLVEASGGGVMVVG